MHKQKHLGKIIVVIVLIVLASVVCLNWRLLKIHYYILKNDHFNKNDKIYLSQKFYFRSDTSRVIPLYGKLTPLNTNEREITDWISLGVSVDTLRKYKTREIGKYMGSFIMYQKDHSKYISAPFVAIKIDKKFIVIDSLYSGFQNSLNYQIDNQVYYLPFSFVTTK